MSQQVHNSSNCIATGKSSLVEAISGVSMLFFGSTSTLISTCRFLFLVMRGLVQGVPWNVGCRHLPGLGHAKFQSAGNSITREPQTLRFQRFLLVPLSTTKIKLNYAFGRRNVRSCAPQSLPIH